MNANIERVVAIATSLSAEDQASLVAFAEFLAVRPRVIQNKVSSDSAPNHPAKTTYGVQACATLNKSLTQSATPVQLSKQLGMSTVIAPPEAESVVAAIKRLIADHPHIERAQLLGYTATLMERFITGACSREDTIAELEKLFAARRRGATGSA